MGVETIICKRCGNETPRTGKRQKYCLDCAYQMIIERQNTRRHQHTKGMTGTKTIVCEMCGDEVTVNIRAGRAKYCSHCAALAYGEAKKRQKKSRVEAHGICVVCGKEFNYVSIGGYERRCCSDCRTRGKLKDRGIIKKPLIKKDSQEKQPKRVSTIADVMQAARRAGMSYGQYKAMMAMKGGG